MKRYIFYILMILISAMIVFIIVGDFFTDTLKRSAPNPYAFDVEGYRKIDTSLISYQEFRRIKLPLNEPVAIDYQNGMLGIGYKDRLQLIDTAGQEISLVEVTSELTALSFSPDGRMFAGAGDEIHIYSSQGIPMDSWRIDRQNVLIRSIAFQNDNVLAADAGNRLVYRLSKVGTLLDSINGKGRLEGNYGFIIPSPYFDMAVDSIHQLWVTNPGLLKIENYNMEGELRAFWGSPSFKIEGFTGCCNPVYLDIMPDGSFLTSEKGLVRVKVYKESGEFDSVVAGPEDFDRESEAPDITVDEIGRIYLLDITRNMVRVFKHNKG